MEGPGYKLKRIVVKPGAALSMQMHKHRSKHRVVISDTANVTNGDRELDIPPNESTFIPVGNKHRLSNPGTEDLVIIEVQMGDYLREWTTSSAMTPSTGAPSAPAAGAGGS